MSFLQDSRDRDQCVFIRGFRVKRVLFRIKPTRIGSDKNAQAQRSPYPFRSDNGLRNGAPFRGSSSSSDTIVNPQQRETSRENHVQRSKPQSDSDNGLRNAIPFLFPGPPPPLPPPINHIRSLYRHPTLQRSDGLRSASSFLGDDLHIGSSSSSLDTIGPAPPISHERSPYRRPTLQRNNGLHNAPSFLDDRLDGTGPPINHKNPQPLPYPSSTALQSNGYLSNASFMTSPSHSSFTEVPNDIAEVYPPGHDYLL